MRHSQRPVVPDTYNIAGQCGSPDRHAPGLPNHGVQENAQHVGGANCGSPLEGAYFTPMGAAIHRINESTHAPLICEELRRNGARLFWNVQNNNGRH